MIVECKEQEAFETNGAREVLNIFTLVLKERPGCAFRRDESIIGNLILEGGHGR